MTDLSTSFRRDALLRPSLASGREPVRRPLATRSTSASESRAACCGAATHLTATNGALA